jgi:hypothetical protein
LFTHDIETRHYIALKLGRRSETGKGKRVTPEFGEQKEEKILPPNSERYSCLRLMSSLIVAISIHTKPGSKVTTIIGHSTLFKLSIAIVVSLL